MTHVIYIIDTYIIAKIATDDGAVVNANSHAEIVKFMIERLKAANAYKSEKLAVLHQVCIETLGNLNHLPVIGTVPVGDECIYFGRSKRPVFCIVPVLFKTEMVFVLAFWNVFFIDEIITYFPYRMGLNDVHAVNG
jgi:hypothetical protein